MNPDELLAQIQLAADGKIRAGGLDLLNQVLRQHAHLSVGDARALVFDGLKVLKDEGKVKLPTARHLWDYSARAPIPLWIALIQPSEEVSSWSHRSHPWHPALGFIADLKSVSSSEDSLALDRWLRALPPNEPFVPVKERSWEIFGEEKKLEALAETKLFDAGRLSFEILRCYVVEHVPVHRVFPNGARGVIISENEAGFDSLCRAGAELGSFRAVVFGNGLAIEKSVAFLVRFAAEHSASHCLYIGDIDEAGLAIPHRLNAALLSASASGLSLRPWIKGYSLMLGEPDDPGGENPATTSWLPTALDTTAQEIIAKGSRVAQESCGWKAIRALLSHSGNEAMH